MDKYSISVPGDVLDERIAFGLTFTELVALASIPFVFVLPALFIRRIPVTVILALVAVGYAGVGVIIVATPAGQSPLVWFPAHVTRRVVKPDAYQLKSRDDAGDGSPTITYKNVVHTAPLITKEQQASFADEDVIELIGSIKYAERVAFPETVSGSVTAEPDKTIVGGETDDETPTVQDVTRVGPGSETSHAPSVGKTGKAGIETDTHNTIVAGHANTGEQSSAHPTDDTGEGTRADQPARTTPRKMMSRVKTRVSAQIESLT